MNGIKAACSHKKSIGIGKANILRGKYNQYDGL